MTMKNAFIHAVAGGFLLVAHLVAQGPPDGPPGGFGPGAPGGRGGSGAGGRAGRGGARGGFTQFTRELAPPDVLARGKAVYETNCASCHASDLRGVPPKGHSLLHSLVALDDKHGELVGAELLKHASPITLSGGDPVAVAEYIHSILATGTGQGGPPNRPDGSGLNILVGDPKAGEAYVKANCLNCHSLTGDLKGIATKIPDPRNLQGAWVSGTAGGGGRGFGGGRGGAGGGTGTVTFKDGRKLEGRISRNDDFLVVITLADGTRKSIARVDGEPKVDIVDPQAAHKAMVMKMDDPHNKNMHDVTAYLATLK
jgi:cytochrome c oxidase cbb3-type subunit 3